MKKKLNVLSLFDGMSCGRIALDRAGIKVKNYYASELDKPAIQISSKNWPEINHLGDVKNWRSWNIDFASIDLLIGGSPCQGFSRSGKQLAFSDSRSVLFFEFVNICNHIKQLNPKVKFMLENVQMKKEWIQIITDFVKVQPIYIDSKLVSAQTRKRYYWTNIEGVQIPEDRNIQLKDILENVSVPDFGNSSEHIEIINNKLRVKEATKKGFTEAGIGEGLDLTFPTSKTRRGRLMKEKSNCLTAASCQYGIVTPFLTWRKLTVLEWERLQTLPDRYTEGPSNSQRLKMIGNGWTVDVIAHIFSYLKKI